ncbi:MAG: glycoside hydrolase family 97 catalytic domain-containing protein [Cytophagaceae bacterium]|nr:glycoside hydrolase family 97 catalytic domain-containing protein [Cytophagaceae bacterium]
MTPKIFKTIFLLLIVSGLSFQSFSQKNTASLFSPNKQLEVICDLKSNSYSVKFKGETVLKNSQLGITREDGDFSKNLRTVKISTPALVIDNYNMVNAKKSKISYKANESIWETINADGQKMNIVFRISNDGVAFRYVFPEKSTDIKKISAENTSFHFPLEARAWLQPKAEAQSGWEHSNPSYEAHYELDIPVGKASPGPNGWIYPALFKTTNAWVAITEADLGENYCGTALQQNSPSGEYTINFPQPAEVFTDGVPTLNPESTLPWKSPWRILAIGELKTVMESTLGTDLAQPAIKMDPAIINPGKSSWSWILKKDDSTVFNVQKKYVDFASDMKWQYCLLDATWDKLMGYDSVKILADYAKTKNVGLILWYNSAGSWNTVIYTPKDKLLTHESRVAEFAKLKAMGIKGLKIDFFGGDGQSFMKYYRDILKDAADYGLLINFHGATLPRGLQRTFPNFMTAEAIFGYEMITFSQHSADKEAEHSTMAAMVRNLYDPMDFTPMNLYKIPRIKRKTTAAFELATSVCFLSGIQHYAESPEGMKHVPEEVKNFLRKLPNHWDDVKFIDGYPGKLYVVARKSGNRWYLAGINGENTEKELSLNLGFLKGKTGKLIANGKPVEDEPSFSFSNISIPASGNIKIKLAGNDGFIIEF